MIQVLIALMLFTFFAIGGLVADLGAVRLTQQQMQVGTRGAALEGMRLKDTVSEDERREAAARMLRIHYDNDFEETAGDPSRFGAGPDITLTGGTGSMAANQQINVAPGIVYKPEPQLNLANERHGDLVSGYFNEADDQNAEDPSTYTRTDFDTTGQPGWREAFLVRLRRTTGNSALDSQPGVSSRGPQMPYLFARGSMMAAGNRAPGVTTRSTSVAAARNTTLVGRPLEDAEGNPIHGYGPVALEYELWQTGFSAGEVFTLQFNREGGKGKKGRGGTGRPDDNPYPFGPPIIPPGQTNGSITAPNWAFLEDPADMGALSVGGPLAVSTDLDASSLAVLLQAFGIDIDDLDEDGDTLQVNQTFLVPVYWGDVRIPWDGVPGKKWDNVDPEGLAPRLVGFGSIDILTVTLRDVDEDDGGNNGNKGKGKGNGKGNDNNGNNGPRVVVTLRKRATLTWPRNVSAVEIPGLAGLGGGMARDILDLNRNLDEPARAAALVR